MNLRKTVFFALLVFSLFVIGCADQCGTSQHGFTIQTVVKNTLGNFSPNPNVNVEGHILTVPYPPQGKSYFNQTTGADAKTFVEDGVVGFDWYLTQLQLDHPAIPCAPQTVRINVDLGTYPLDCAGGSNQFSVSPEEVQYPFPTSLQVTGSGISNTYGAPPVVFYDETGNLVAQKTASSVASGGTSITVPSPNFSTFTSGYYLVAVFNITSNGTWDKAGGDYIYVNSNMPPAVPPYGTCPTQGYCSSYCTEQCSKVIPSQWQCVPECTSSCSSGAESCCSGYCSTSCSQSCTGVPSEYQSQCLSQCSSSCTASCVSN